MLSFAKKIFPYNRSIVSREVLRTLKIIKKEVKLIKIHKVKSSTKFMIGKSLKNGRLAQQKFLI